jgi:hypothetical protein
VDAANLRRSNENIFGLLVIEELSGLRLIKKIKLAMSTKQ